MQYIIAIIRIDRDQIIFELHDLMRIYYEILFFEP